MQGRPSTAHPCPHREQHEGLRAAARAPAPLGQRERVHVVVHEGGRARDLGEELGHGNAGQLGHMMRFTTHRSRCHVHEAGQPRSHAEEAVPPRGRQRDHLGGQGENPLDRASTFRPVGGPAARHEHPPVGRDDAGGHGGAAHVHPEQHAVVGIAAGHGPSRGRRYPATT